MTRLILNYKILFFYLLFFSTILKSAALAKTDKIGYLSMIDGDVTTVDSNNKFIKINEFDEINVGQVIIFAENSSSVETSDFDKMGIIEKTLNLTVAPAKNDQKNNVLEAIEELHKLYRKTGNISPN
jgi:hypothetical protein